MAAEEFPKVQGGGSLMLAWQIKGKNVLVVGGGEVAAGRILSCLNADAHVTVLCPYTGLNPEVAHRVQTSQVAHLDRNFSASDLPATNPSSYALILAAIDDPQTSTQIYTLAREARIPANIADVPPECDFYFGSVHRDGPLQIMVSTGGNGPRLAAAVRRRVAEAMPPGIGDAIVRVGRLRRLLREKVPQPEMGKERMVWMSRVCDMWKVEELLEMRERDMLALLEGFERGEVRSLREIRGEPEEGVWSWDGSFGWM